MLTVRLTSVLGGTGLAIVASALLGGMAFAATTPALLDSSTPGAVVNDSSSTNVSQTNTVTTIVSTTSKVTLVTGSLGSSNNTGDGSASSTQNSTVTPVEPSPSSSPKSLSNLGSSVVLPVNNQASLVGSSPLAQSQVTAAAVTSSGGMNPLTAQVVPAAMTSAILHSVMIPHLVTSISQPGSLLALRTPQSIVGIISKANLSSSHAAPRPANHKAINIIGQLTLLLSRSLTPLVTVIVALVTNVRSAFFSKVIASALVILTGIAILAGYVARLRRSGYAGAPRSGMANTATASIPLLMGYSFVAKRNILGGPFFVGSPVFIQTGLNNA